MSWHEQADDDEAGPDPELPGPLLPPEDRLWRHPSELYGLGSEASRSSCIGRGRRRLLPVAALSLAILAFTAGALLVTPGLDESAGDSAAGGDPSPATSATRNSDAASRLVFGIRIRRGDRWVNGSATVFRRDGVLLTTRRLVLDADEVVVELGPMGTQPARVVGTDAHTDVAVLDMGVPALGQSARWADETPDGPISIIGYDGRGRRASIGGAVRAKDVRERDPGGIAVDGMIRTDTDVPVEMTGGALIDERGVVVGLVNAMPFEDDDTHDGGQAIAAPVAVVIAETILVGTGQTRHAWLGVEVADMDPEGITGSGRPRVVVKGLAADGPAADAEVEVGDVVVAVDGADVASTSDLIALLRQRRGGDIVTVDLVRDGTERRVEVTLGARADDD